jgi:hypothetical protein
MSKPIQAGANAVSRVLPAAAASGYSGNIEQKNATQPQPEQPQIAPQSNAGGYFDKLAQAESGGDVNAKNPNSSASGKYQFTNDTWKSLVEKHGKQTGITMRDKNNPQAQDVFAELFTKENADILTNKLGRQPTDGDLYVAHFFGAPQAAKFISNVGTNKAAFAVVPPRVVQANKSIFFKNSKINQPRSVDEVYALLSNKVA